MASLARLQLKSEFRQAINNPTLLQIDIDVEICHFKGDKIVLKFVFCRASRLVVLGGIIYINCIPTIVCIKVSNNLVKISKIVSMASLARLQLKSEFRQAINNPTLLLIDIDVLNFFYINTNLQRCSYDCLSIREQF